jgi:hypothetical protein
MDSVLASELFEITIEYFSGRSGKTAAQSIKMG